MNILHLEVEEQRSEHGLRRVMTLHHEGGARHEIFHESVAFVPLQEDTPLDGQILTVLLYAMKLGLALHVHGPVTHQMMRNLEELQHYWQRWQPEFYQKVEIRADRVIDARRVLPESRAVAAFSGGVDASFLALCHTRALPKSVQYPLTDLVMVHGFDVPLRDAEGFARLKQRVTPTADELGLELQAIRTNSKLADIQDWESSYGMQIAACLHQLSDRFDVMLIGSAEPYNELIHPWGSTPLTDSMCSGDLIHCVHDGSGYVRTQKVEVISRNPTICKTLRVCWIGEDKSKNCGVCEKCLRTMMNFLAVGAEIPPCFETAFDVSRVRAMHVIGVQQYADIKTLLDYAKARGIQADWVDALEYVLSRRMPWQKSWAHLCVARLLDAVGLKGFFKRIFNMCR